MMNSEREGNSRVTRIPIYRKVDEEEEEKEEEERWWRRWRRRRTRDLVEVDGDPSGGQKEEELAQLNEELRRFHLFIEFLFLWKEKEKRNEEGRNSDEERGRRFIELPKA